MRRKLENKDKIVKDADIVIIIIKNGDNTDEQNINDICARIDI